jgi:ribosomal protein L11 methyltransferase
MSEKQWVAFDVTTTPRNREAIEYGLMEAGALGTETIDAEDAVRVTGYFENAIVEDEVRRALADAGRLYNARPDDIDRIDFKVRAVADRDWLAEWKKSWQPVQAGRFIVAPPWLSESRCIGIAGGPSTEAILIQINPGMAFGTGTHETTRLCLQAIDKYYEGGSFLDVGTGTGVLAIAAAKCQKPDTGVPSRAARRVWGSQGGHALIHACDVDADAIEIAKQNAELNGVADRIDFQVGSVDETNASADFVCANLTAPVIIELLPRLIGATCGRLVLSGILDSQEELVRSGLAEFGITNFEVDRDGEWIAIVV